MEHKLSDSTDVWIDELQKATMKAGMNYEIWWVYKHDRTKYVKTMRRYNVFFSASIHAHFVAMVMALYLLYETRKKRDTYSVPHFLEKLKAEGVEIGGAESLYKKAKPLWIKISILRNNVFGHRSRSCTIEEVFKKAGIQPKAVKKLIELTKQLLNCCAPACSPYSFGSKAERETIKLLSKLDV